MRMTRISQIIIIALIFGAIASEVGITMNCPPSAPRRVCALPVI